MRAPAFWHKPSSISSLLLHPLACVYEHFTQKRAHKPPEWVAPVPVICVGNISMGGTGKTPTVRLIGEYLKAKGKNPYVLSRGYGGNFEGSLIVQSTDRAAKVGDEPLLLSQNLPICVSRNRVLGAKKCVEEGADIILMDDGFQNPQLKKDLSLIVIDGQVGQGNEKVFPAGPLRETLKSGLNRCDGVMVIGEDKYHVKHAVLDYNSELPVLSARVIPALQDIDKTCPYVAFAGIGRPEKFFKTLTDHHFQLKEMICFDDHHLFTKSDIEKLKSIALKNGAVLICTEKDWIRLDPEVQKEIIPFKIKLECFEMDKFETLLSPFVS